MSPVEIVGWTLLHSLWQGTAVGLILFALLAVINRRRATTRYAVSLSALAIMACLPVATGFALYGRTADWSAQPGALSIVARPGESPQPRADATVSREVSEAALGSGPADRDSGKDRVIGRGAELLQPVLPWLVGLWVTGVILLSIRLVAGLTRARRLVTDGTRAASGEIEALFPG